MQSFYFRWIFLIHGVVRSVVYCLMWALVFSVLAWMATKSPAKVQDIITFFNPVTKALNDLFWHFAPIPQEVVAPTREILAWAGSKARKAAAWVGPTAELTLNVALTGFIAVSVISWVLHLLPMFLINCYMRNKLAQLFREDKHTS